MNIIHAKKQRIIILKAKFIIFILFLPFKSEPIYTLTYNGPGKLNTRKYICGMPHHFSQLRCIVE